MAIFTVKVKDNKFLNALKRAPETVSREMRIQLKQEMEDTADYAKQNHIYNTKGGFLEDATQSEVDDRTTAGSLGLLGRIFIDLGLAIYGRRIHQGGGGLRDSLGRKMTNKPDEFLVGAMKFRKKAIKKAMTMAMNRGLKKAGLK